MTVDYEGAKVKTRRNGDPRGRRLGADRTARSSTSTATQERVARISFTPQEKNGEWLVDDLYIDPFARR